MILRIIALLDLFIMALLIVAMIVPFWREKAEPHKGVPLAKGFDRSNGGFYLLIWMTCIGAVILSFIAVVIYLFGDMLINRFGLSWFSSTIKLTVYRTCNNTIASFCWTAMLCGVQCKLGTESFSWGFLVLFPAGFLSVLAVGLVYYYPCAPSGGEWSMFFGRTPTTNDDDDDDFDVDARSDDSGDQPATHKKVNYGATKTSKTLRKDRRTEGESGSSGSDDDTDESWWPSAFTWGQTGAGGRRTGRSSTDDLSDIDEEDGRRSRARGKKSGWGWF